MGTLRFLRQAIPAIASKIGYEIVDTGIRSPQGSQAYTFVSETLLAAEAHAKHGDLAAALGTLRELPLDHLGLLLLEPPSNFEALRAVLPTMPSREIQVNWTGTAGAALLRRSCAFTGPQQVVGQRCFYCHRTG